MVRGLAEVLGASMRSAAGGVLRIAGVAAAAFLLSAVSLGFGTFAAYDHLRGMLGQAVAALIVCGVYALLGVATLAIGAVRRRAGPPRSAAAATETSALLRSIDGPGVPQDALAIGAALRLALDMAPAHGVLLALVGGIVVGRGRAK